MQLPAATQLVNLTEFSIFFENYDNHAKLKNELVEFQIVESLTEKIESLICKTYLQTKKKIDYLGNIPATRLGKLIKS